LAQATDIDVTADNVEALLDDYLHGRLSNPGIVALFQYLIDSGLAWELHPMMQDATRHILDSGLVTGDSG